MPPDAERRIRLIGRSSGEERARYGLLLLAIVAAFAVQGIARPGQWEQFVVALLLATTLVLAMWAGQARPWVLRASLVVSALVVVLSLVEAVTGHGRGVVTNIANLLLVILAPPMVVVGILRNLRARQRVTFEALFGVLCVYLLVGMFFAFLYGVIGHINGTFFANNVQSTSALDLYYSFITMTTVGYGDYTAASNLGHTLSVAEALIGQVYLVTVVSVIVANLGRNRPTANGPS
ncbi:MAG: potassium channel family protein [Solirubrobacteraceae bacterium]